ncbi:MAG TPA: hypothetical protein V6D06_18600 [Trichocoleus sp.]
MVDPQHSEYWRKAMAAQQQHQQQATTQAWAEVEQIAERLRQAFGATRIIMLGSW